MKCSQKVKVKNALGLHARPATVISSLLQKSKSKVWLTYRGQKIDARSVMSVLMLAASKNAEIQIDVKGEDAKVTLESLVYAFETEFGEEVESSV